MERILFLPLSVLGGLLATMVGRKAVRRIWGAVDDAALPSADRRDTSSSKLVAGLAIEGAVFSIARGLTDHGLRKAVYWATGRWPGDSATAPRGDDELDQTDPSARPS